MKTPHEILGIPLHASKADAKKAYKELVKQYHPDVSKDPQAAQKFIEIQAAYEAMMSGTSLKKRPRPSPQPRPTRRRPATSQAKQESVKTTGFAHAQAFGSFLLLAWNLFALLYFFPKTCITPLVYVVSIGFVSTLFFMWLWLFLKKHKTYAAFFATLYGAGFIHLMLALNMLFSSPLPDEIHHYTLNTEFDRELVGKDALGRPVEQVYANHSHVLYLDHDEYGQYPQIRLVWQNKDDFYRNQYVKLRVSEGLYGIKVLEDKVFVGE